MDEVTLNRAREFIQKKPYLVWGTVNYGKLSAPAIVENILNFGDWADFIFIKDLFGLRELGSLFEQVAGKKRVNLRPQTRNYFVKFFSRYAS